MTSAAVDVTTRLPESAPKAAGKSKRSSVDVDELIEHLKSTLTRFLTTREARVAGCTVEGPANSVECEMYARALKKWLKINAVELYKNYKLTSHKADVDFDCLFAAVEEYFDDETSRDNE